MSSRIANIVIAVSLAAKFIIIILMQMKMLMKMGV